MKKTDGSKRRRNYPVEEGCEFYLEGRGTDKVPKISPISTGSCVKTFGK